MGWIKNGQSEHNIFIENKTASKRRLSERCRKDSNVSSLRKQILAIIKLS